MENIVVLGDGQQDSADFGSFVEDRDHHDKVSNHAARSRTTETWVRTTPRGFKRCREVSDHEDTVGKLAASFGTTEAVVGKYAARFQSTPRGFRLRGEVSNQEDMVRKLAAWFQTTKPKSARTRRGF